MAVVKSPNDPRDYRVIHLDNGLTALLISDTNTVSTRQRYSSEVSDMTDDSNDDSDGLSDDECDDDEIGINNDDEQENDEDNNCDEKPKDAKLAAAALCIGTGSFSDPDDIPGLAHFLEHMVFMGSTKYPEENAFDAFIKKHGGSSNACTDCERTVFVFDVRRKYFPEALDRFAQFFISPLMKEGSVDREIQAIESEFMQSYQSDTVKRQQLLQSLSKDGHPLKKFLWGSEATLKSIPSQKGINVQNHLRSFHNRMYSSHYMTLAVCSKEPLDRLEELVKSCFTGLPYNNLPRPTFEDCPMPFDDSLFCKLYKVVPVKDFHQLDITWVLPSQLQHYRIKPMHYISWLLGHEGPGSILSLLIKRSWAVSLLCGNGETGIEHSTNYATFPVIVILTDEGMEHIYEIITIVFQYMEMLRKEGPQERIYKEIQTIEDNEFRFQEQLYPPEDFLTGDQLMWDFDPKVIGEVLELLVPDKANIMISSKNYTQDECTEIEDWFQTNYSCTDINPAWLESWKNLEINSDLFLPTENTFIATDFEIKDKDLIITEVILESELGKLWHKKDNKFNTPRARYYFHLISPNVNTSPKSIVLSEMFLKVLEYNLKEISYAADVAQLRSIRLSILQLIKWSIVEKEGAIESITLDDLKLYCESLIQGNVTSSEAISLQEHLYKMVNASPLPSSLYPEVRVVELPSTETFCRVPTFNKDDSNSVVTDYYQCGPATVQDFSIMEILVSQMEEPCFDILRTREQLGYSVSCTCRNTFGIIGFSLTVQSQADKFSVDHIKTRIDAFLEEFLEILENTSAEDFKSQVDSLIEIKEHEDLSLSEEANRNWFEILDRTYLFDRRQKEVNALKSTSKKDVLHCFKANVKKGHNFKMLSVQVVGNSDVTSSQPNDVSSQGRWTLRTVPVENRNYITDIADFKRSRPVFPVSKVV